MKEYVKLNSYNECHDIVVRTTIQIEEYKGKFETVFTRSNMYGAEAIISGIFGIADTEENWTALGKTKIERDELGFEITLVNKDDEIKKFIVTYLQELNPHIVAIKIVKNEPYSFSI